MRKKFFFGPLMAALTIMFLSACGSRSDHSHAHEEKGGHADHAHGKESGGHEAPHAEEGHHDEGHEGVHLTPEQMKLMNVEVLKAAKRPFRIYVEALGEIASDTDRVTQVRPEEPGTVEAALVNVGETVKAGEGLLRYRPDSGNGEPKELVSPAVGMLVGLYTTEGAHIEPALPIATVADTSRLRASLDVFEKDIGRVAVGQTVEVLVSAYPDETFAGRVTYISPRVDESARTVKTRVDVTNPGGKLRFGMFVEGRIRVAERRALAVPEEAIQDIEGKPSVFVADHDGGFVPVPVKLGERSLGWIEVLSGLEEGKEFVSKGSYVLKADRAKSEAGHDH